MNNLQLKSINITDLLKELKFKTSRSSGAGGQNVNKVSSKVTLIFNISNSYTLNDENKEILKGKLAKKISADGNIQMSASTDRSQLMNKKKVIEKFLNLLNKAFEIEEIRIETKPSRASKEKRLASKAIVSEKKKIRRSKLSFEE
jgi:ribosome-associated protein